MQLKLNPRNFGGPQPTRRAALLCCLALLPMLLWTGCKPEGKSGINPAGTYALVSVDGKKVPCPLQHEGTSMTIKGGTFIIGPDGTCSSKMVFTLPARGDGSREVKATYTQDGPKLTMKWQGAGMTTGTVEGDTFTMNNEGMLLTYRK